ncbi:hypothetical protein [Piscinibacter koreensis]|uniref:Uncharacterized protein n=1 Tax=Piscinibacter koreensis TaxID=2742824 RepID=A0A7Y6NR53_9BURK|nr:hypothetical protein [Schlegelella koreensis]NUZ07808.1 hypothetical protein [Schlegelella koreensis]
MSHRGSELMNEYERLRRQLEAAYAAPVWDSGRIDGIIDAIAQVERTLGARAGLRRLANWRVRDAAPAAAESAARPADTAGTGWTRGVAGSARRGLAAAVEAVASVAGGPAGARGAA